MNGDDVLQGFEVYVCFPVQVMVDDTEDGQQWPRNPFRNTVLDC